MSTTSSTDDLEVRILKAELDPEKYQPEQNEQSGQTYLRCHYPDELQQDIDGFQQKHLGLTQSTWWIYAKK